MNLFAFFLLQAPTQVVSGEGPVVSTMARSLSKLLQEVSDALPYLLLAVTVFALFLVIARIAAFAVKVLMVRMRGDEQLAGLLGGLTSFVLTLAGALFSVLVLFPGYEPLQVIGALSAISVAVGFVFRDIADNFFSGLIILWRKPYVVGDEIKVGNYEGTVVGFTFRSTLIKTYANELVFIRNSKIYSSALTR